MNDVRQWNIEFRAEDAERELLRALQGVARKIVRGESAVEDDQSE
ncbi:hypothetical protein ACFVT6_24070 [Streptomyces sp. NPDC058049]